ncbi:hypothetical protein NC652_036352 [Populus alba x Populus x berolinensis]|nr:hypothetical protein NC652_036352 [Populus alba x Populus x berolinensis]
MDTALLQDSQEQTNYQNYESDAVERLFRVLMITKDLGLPNNSEKILTKKKKKPKGEGEGIVAIRTNSYSLIRFFFHCYLAMAVKPMVIKHLIFFHSWVIFYL